MTARTIERRGERTPMQYRRFGRTNKALSVITLGGMRFPHGWTAPRDALPQETIDSCRDWVPGAYATAENIAKVDMSRAPAGVPLRELLAETHRELHQPRGPKRPV